MLDAGEYPTAYASGMRITFDAQYLPAERDERGLGGQVKAELERFFAKSRHTMNGCSSTRRGSSG